MQPQQSEPTLQPAPPSTMPSATELMNIPAPVTRLLLDLAPFIAHMRHAAEILNWSSSRSVDSWLVLAAWWASCLLTGVSVRYFLPFALLATLPQLQPTRSQLRVAVEPATERTLCDTLEHIARTQSLLPSLPQLPTYSPQVVVRVIAITWVPSILALYAIRVRVLLAIVGTIALTWRAPFAVSLRSALASSAYVRHGAARVWSVLSGIPLPIATMPVSVTPTTSATSASQQGSKARFILTVYENQRWWVGLDWTAALVPSERPSWCASNQQPIAPPAVFALPSPTTIYTSDGKDGRLKRTAHWTWEEHEWKVLVRREVNGAPEVRRVEKQPQPVTEDVQSSSKLAKKLKEAVSSSSQDAGVMSPTEGKEPHADVQEHLTDADGWTYFDNKWENPNNKGGMGKFTRHRRWTRIAVLVEEVENVGPGYLGIFREDANPAPVLQPVVTKMAVNTTIVNTGPVNDAPGQDPGSPTALRTPDSPTTLRQRLQNVIKSS
ncbi:integral peroxisomal membrane peroxin-domain-containing protein [Auriculariales sp. MPI-PUGE-AT-0066]|nr:integral peroxisomal membrane peroxin-domain-containing protein [Auriculariales sp. MPI-PUGE-AT-0066]